MLNQLPNYPSDSPVRKEAASSFPSTPSPSSRDLPKDRDLPKETPKFRRVLDKEAQKSSFTGKEKDPQSIFELSKDQSKQTKQIKQSVEKAEKGEMAEKAAKTEKAKKSDQPKKTRPTPQPKENSLDKPKDARPIQPKEPNLDKPKDALPIQPKEPSLDKPKDALPIQPKEPSLDKPKDTLLIQPKEPSLDKPKDALPIQPKEPSLDKPKDALPIQPKEPSLDKPKDALPIQPKEPSLDKPKDALPIQPKEPSLDKPKDALPIQPKEPSLDKPKDALPIQPKDALPIQPKEPSLDEPKEAFPSPHPKENRTEKPLSTEKPFQFEEKPSLPQELSFLSAQAKQKSESPPPPLKAEQPKEEGVNSPLRQEPQGRTIERKEQKEASSEERKDKSSPSFSDPLKESVLSQPIISTIQFETTSSSLQDTPGTSRLASIKELVDKMIEQIQVLEHNDLTFTRVTLHSPPVLEGTTLTLEASPHAEKEFNVSFSDLSEDGKRFLDQKLKENSLTDAMQEAGYVIHIVTTTTEEIPLFQEKNQQNPQERDQEQPKDQRRHPSRDREDEE